MKESSEVLLREVIQENILSTLWMVFKRWDFIKKCGLGFSAPIHEKSLFMF
jgi:hypothetical protein